MRLCVVLLVLLNASCIGKPPKPDWKLWAGDSDKAGITRSQDNLTISCAEVRFDDYVCLSYEDFKRNTLKIIESCKKWGGGTQRLNLNELERDPIMGPMFFSNGGFR